MDSIRAKLNQPIALVILGFVVGLVIGWFVIGWGVWPVAWTDASPADLHPGYQKEYLQMTIAAYSLDRDAATAHRRWNDLGEAGPAALAAIEAASPVGDPNLQAFKALLALPETPGPYPAPASGESGGSGLGGLLGGACLVTLLLGAAVGGLWYMRSQQNKTPVEKSPAMQAMEASRTAERIDYAATGEEPPLSSFMTTYILGDDLFDDSFSVDSPAGEFLGECGVGIADTVGVGDPKRVTAFEVWLFDKNDIQTVTKVLMTNHAFNEIGLREKLAAKGEPVLARPGDQFTLETATLQLAARVVDMSYGAGGPEADSFFERLTLELAVWKK